MSRMTAEQVERQLISAYGRDRLPGSDSRLDRFGLLDAPPPITARPKDGKCRKCGKPIVGRPPTASTCLLHRQYTHPPTRDELVALIEENRLVGKQLRAELRRMDKEASA